MIFRRKDRQPDAESDAGQDAAPEETAAVEDESARFTPPARPDGPWDAEENDVEHDDATAIDFGALIVLARQGLDIRVQADPSTNAVSAIVLVDRTGAMELRPFAVPRGEGLWDDVRGEIIAETTRRGGTATDSDGEFAKELTIKLPVEAPDGQSSIQVTRLVGIDGPRWFLRATFLGRAALESGRESLLNRALRDVIVVRGTGPMSPREPLPLMMPDSAVISDEQQT